MNQGKNRIARGGLGLCLALAAPAALAEFTPATFSTGERSLETLIEFPELRGDVSVTISCIGLLARNGKLDEHGCYQQNPGDEAFIATIYKAAKKARLVPATIDGKAVTVVFQYRAHFTKKGEDEAVQFVANPGYQENVEAYGAEHVAAQRVYAKEGWEKSCPKQARFIVMVRANVDYDGTPSAASVTHLNGINVTEKCEQAIINSVLESRFVPAHAGDETVPSTFVEPFGN